MLYVVIIIKRGCNGRYTDILTNPMSHEAAVLWLDAERPQLEDDSVIGFDIVPA